MIENIKCIGEVKLLHNIKNNGLKTFLVRGDLQKGKNEGYKRDLVWFVFDPSIVNDDFLNGKEPKKEWYRSYQKKVYKEFCITSDSPSLEFFDGFFSNKRDLIFFKNEDNLKGNEISVKVASFLNCGEKLFKWMRV